MNAIAPHSRTSERLKLIGFWMVVGVPLAWGIWQVGEKSLALFGLGH